jgi:hypothetical protein
VQRILGALMLGLGGILAVGGLLLLGEAVSAWIERVQYGSGLMFADAEVFLVLGLAVAATGAVALWAGLRLMGLLPIGKNDWPG